MYTAVALDACHVILGMFDEAHEQHMKWTPFFPEQESTSSVCIFRKEVIKRAS
jgi:hypothetical protein